MNTRMLSLMLATTLVTSCTLSNKGGQEDADYGPVPAEWNPTRATKTLGGAHTFVHQFEPCENLRIRRGDPVAVVVQDIIFADNDGYYFTYLELEDANTGDVYWVVFRGGEFGNISQTSEIATSLGTEAIVYIGAQKWSTTFDAYVIHAPDFFTYNASIGGVENVLGSLKLSVNSFGDGEELKGTLLDLEGEPEGSCSRQWEREETPVEDGPPADALDGEPTDSAPGNPSGGDSDGDEISPDDEASMGEPGE